MTVLWDPRQTAKMTNRMQRVSVRVFREKTPRATPKPALQASTSGVGVAESVTKAVVALNRPAQTVKIAHFAGRGVLCPADCRDVAVGGRGNHPTTFSPESSTIADATSFWR